MTTRIAVPVIGNTLSSHFGQCSAFAVFEVDPETAIIDDRQDLTPPEHAPGVYPQWLAGQGVSIVLAGGIGGRARQLFEDNHIDVVLGVEAIEADSAVRSYLAGQLVSGSNACNHGPSHTCDH